MIDNYSADLLRRIAEAVEKIARKSGWTHEEYERLDSIAEHTDRIALTLEAISKKLEKKS